MAKHVSIPASGIEFISMEPTEYSPLISHVQIKVCYVSDKPNRNGSIITKEVAEEMAPTLRGCPIVGFYNENTGDFEEHNRVIDISKGKFDIKDTTRPYGFVPLTARVWFQKFADDGIEHEYLCTEGYLWTGQYPESQRVIEHGNNQSMELDEKTLNAHWTENDNGNSQFFIINEAIMSKLCILGEDVEPCFEGSQIAPIQFTFADNFKEELFALVKQMQKILDEGGAPVFNRYAVEIGDSLWDAIYSYIIKNYPGDDWCSIYRLEGIYEEDDQKFAILQNRNDMKYYRLDFSLDEENGFVPTEGLIEVTKTYVPAEEPQFAPEAVEAYEARFSKQNEDKDENDKDEASEAEKDEQPAEEPKTEESSDESAEAENSNEQEQEEKKNYVLEEIAEYVELSEKYDTLNNEYSALEEKVTNLNNEIQRLISENKTLNEFKMNIDREKKQELINSFYMLSDDDKKDCIDNIDTYSYDDIEAKLCILCVRNKVSFDLDNDEGKKNEKMTFNLSSVEDDDAGLPGWIQRVKEVAKEKNI